MTINVPAARKRSFLILRTRFARGGEFARFSGLEEDNSAVLYKRSYGSRRHVGIDFIANTVLIMAW